MKSVLSLQAVYTFVGSLFLYRKINGKFLFAYLNTLINSNSVPEAATEFLSGFSSLPLVDFHLCFSAIGRSSPEYGSLPASGILSLKSLDYQNL
jgi:hypothetical protein